MAKTFKVLSALLSYPTEEICAAAGEMQALLARERLLSASDLACLEPLFEELASNDLFDLQERYVLLFDRTRSLSLHLFEHVHGESRDRGQAMVDLLAVYERGGLQVTANELPDYLPLFLEFLSTRPLAEALDLVAQPAHILAALQERLRKRKSSYGAVFAALAKLARVDASSPELRALLAEPDVDPTDLKALDDSWVDAEVRFGPDAEDGCGSNALSAKLRAGNRPAPGLPETTQSGPRVVFTHSSAKRE